MKFPPSIRDPQSTIGAKRPGIALLMTIIAIAGLALLLIGLLTVLTLERKTARSYSDAARADLAVESGLATALATLTQVAKRDDTIVFRIEDPAAPNVASTERPLGFREQFFTYGAIYENGAWRGIPFFSGSPETALGTREIQADLLTPGLTAYAADAEPLGHLTDHDQNIPRAKWVEIPADPSDPKDYTIRYAFWIEDLSGRIDGRSAGKFPRSEGLSTAELDYATVLTPESETPVIHSAFNAAKEKLRTSASIRPFFSGSSEAQGKRLEPYIHFLPPPSGPTPPRLIPQGFGYADAGLPAHDLNALVTARDVIGIAEIINRNLPKFEQRKGGFPDTENYVKTLAASIIDYADTDSNATTGPGYRGVDSYPFVNEMYDRYEITKQTEEATEISVETYIELWNLSQQSITGKVEFKNINKMKFLMPPGTIHQFTDFAFPPINVAIPANGFRVIYAGEKTYSFPHTFGRPVRLTFTASSQNNFELRWNGTLVDKSRRGVERASGFLDTAPLPSGDDKYTYNWKGNGSPTHDTNASQTGDPRASYYVDSRIRNHSYDKSNWGGRSEKRGGTIPHTYEVRLTDWPDRGSNSTSGTQPTNDKVRPTSKTSAASAALDDGTPYPENQPEMAPAFISDKGSYNSTAELGNIFDPAQWEKIEDKANHASQKNAGGGHTLAIGRPEFYPFDNDGLRASQLLDLFWLVPEPASALTPAQPVNINTAPREVLRSLFGGLSLSGDPANHGVDPPKGKVVGDLFADHVIAYRSEFSLRGLSDLNLIGKRMLPAGDITRFFGNSAVYPNGSMPDDDWDDAGREELFRKVAGLVAFQSKVFRIIVKGEAIDKNGLILSRAISEYHYRVEPTRDPAGLILPSSLVKITKLYEKAL